jgi:hypothetical protein
MVYVSEVKYGRLILFYMTGTESVEDMAAAVKGGYGGVTAEAEAKLKKVISNSTLSYVSIGSTGEVAVQGIPTGDPSMTLQRIKSVIENGARFNSSSNPGAPIAVTMRYVGSVGAAGPNDVAYTSIVTNNPPRIIDGKAVPVCYGPFTVWDGVGGGWVEPSIPYTTQPGDRIDFLAGGSNWSGVALTAPYGPNGWNTWDAPGASERNSYPLWNRSPFALIGRLGTASSNGYDFTHYTCRSSGSEPGKCVPNSSSFFIGEGQTVYVGSELTPGVGRLFLGTNDSNPFNGDRNRKFSVRLCITAPKP